MLRLLQEVNIGSLTSFYFVFLKGRLVPGTSLTYQEAIVQHTREYLMDNSLSVDQIVNADLVIAVRVRIFMLSIF